MKRQANYAKSTAFALASILILGLSGCSAVSVGLPSPSAPDIRRVAPAQAARLYRIMTPLLCAMDHPKTPKEVYVGIVDDGQINAANAGGGQFYVTTGLLEKANDEQLRGIMAHETAHAGYSENALIDALEWIEQMPEGRGGGGFLSTHPATSDRIEALKRMG